MPDAFIKMNETITVNTRLSVIVLLLLSQGCDNAAKSMPPAEAVIRNQDDQSPSDTDAKIVEFSQRIKDKPKDFDALVGRSRLLRLKGDLKGAMDDVNKAIALSDCAEARIERTLLYFEYDLMHLAAKDARHAIRLDSLSPLAHGYYGRALSNIENYRDALWHLNKAIELDSSLVEFIVDRGFVYECMTQFQKAIDEYSMAIRTDPKFLAGYNSRALVYEDLREYEKALADLTTAIQVDPNYALGFYNRARVQYGLGKTMDALADCDNAIQVGARNTESQRASFYHLKGLIKSKQKLYQDAIASLDEAIKLDSGLVGAFVARGNAYAELQQYKRAISDFDSALLRSPYDPSPHFNRGITYLEMEEFGKAVFDFTRVIELEPEAAGAYHRRGDAYKATGDVKKAESDYAKAKELGFQLDES